VDGPGETMKFINFYGAEGIQAGVVHEDGVEDLATSDLWYGPAPVARSDISALSAKIVAPASRLVPMESLRLAPVVVAPERSSALGSTIVATRLRPICRYLQLR
jgi:hypothetical protein